LISNVESVNVLVLRVIKAKVITAISYVIDTSKIVLRFLVENFYLIVKINICEAVTRNGGEGGSLAATTGTET